VTTVDRAVVLLGLEAIQALVLSVQVLEWGRVVAAERGRASARGLEGPAPIEGDGARFDRIGFWRHSIAVASAAEMIAAGSRQLGVRPEEAFVAGLLHDLGKLALSLILPRAYDRVIELAEVKQANIADIEQSVIGLDHHTAGKRLGARWDLPPMLQDTMWLHAQQYDSLPSLRHKPLIGVVHAADAVCRELHLGWSGNHSTIASLAEVLDPLKVGPARIEESFPRLIETVGARCRDLGLSDEPTERVMVESLRAANRRLSMLNAAMDKRSRAAAEQALALDAISAFSAAVRPEMTPSDVLSAVVASAKVVLGGGSFSALYEGCPGDAWLAIRFERSGEGGRREASDIIDPPAMGDAAEQAGSLAELAARRPADGHVLARRVLDEYMPEQRPAETHVLTLAPASRDETGGVGAAGLPDPGGPVAMLAHNRESQVRGLSRRTLEALVSAWSGAIAAAAHHEESRRLGEQLADANRVLAQTQRELADAQSMARLGELTAGAAHEMNNPLAIISGRCQMLASAASDASQRAAAQAVVDASRRLHDLITRLHIIARPPAARLGKTNLAELVTEAIKRAREQVARKHSQSAGASNVGLRVSLSEKLMPARMDRDLMIQALAEIIVNAIESQPKDNIEIRAYIDGIDDRLVISVTDTGCGMSEHALQHALDPFFSEKPAGRQPGLGLATASRLIALHNGTIRLQSRKGHGTTAMIVLKEWRWREAGVELKAA
jgi:signal transduction histidine kinase